MEVRGTGIKLQKQAGRKAVPTPPKKETSVVADGLRLSSRGLAFKLAPSRNPQELAFFQKTGEASDEANRVRSEIERALTFHEALMGGVEPGMTFLANFRLQKTDKGLYQFSFEKHQETESGKAAYLIAGTYDPTQRQGTVTRQAKL